ncbi:MAG TPA: nucleotidyl transferase AbiEii/AbiGii toxin family protein [Anaerovoracaceae bacterium]|nr:nucleotidyl transferase AbiEii/AbiGii toxin family protein [Anaerovoracaceae bacterium]
MSSYDKGYIAKRATELGFIRDTLEKVYRLADVLEYLNTNPVLRENLALKGGTAINLTIFNLPRLSVDIDLDYLGADSRDDMLKNREVINQIIGKFMVMSGYKLSPKTKNPHSLDSWVYEYINAVGNRDHIKIEINYSMRMHIFPANEMKIITEHFASEYNVKCLAAIEMFGSKINALLSRAAARDLYDVYNMIKFGLFEEEEQQALLRKSVVFYAAISSKVINKNFDMLAIDNITQYKIRRELYPVITKKEVFDLENAKKTVKDYISKLMVLKPQEKEFLEKFGEKEYAPELIFRDEEILGRIKNHPMALWKMRNTNEWKN